MRASLFSLGLAAACSDDFSSNGGSDDCQVGSRHCECTPGGACDDGLACVDALCVSESDVMGAGGMGGEAGDGDEGDGDGDLGDGDLGDGDEASGGSGSGGDFPFGGAGTGAMGGSGSGGDGSGGDGSGGMGSDQCTPVDVQVETPTVYLLLDRSSSMFDEDFWTPLRAALLPALQSVHESLRLGFGTYFGTTVSCGGLEDSGGIGTGRYSAIDTYYSAIPEPSVKYETPTAQAIDQVTSLLDADPGAQGNAIIVLVTDGNPDFCNDGVDDCAADATVYRLQQAAASGYHTEVFGVGGLYREDYLNYFAQAGQGESPDWEEALDVTEFAGAIYTMCNSISEDWKEIWEASGATQYNPIGSYSPSSSSTSAHFASDPTVAGANVASYLKDQIPCVVTLDGDTIGAGEESDFNVWLGEAQLEGADWQRISSTQIELLGAACESYRSESSTTPFVERCE